MKAKDLINLIEEESRYFHATTKEKAEVILRDGYSHAKPNSVEQDVYFWFNYYHLFVEAYYSEEEFNEIKDFLWDKTKHHAERGKFFRESWTKKYGDNWTLLWIGKNEVHKDFGKVVLEFFPSEKDKIVEDRIENYYVAIRLEDKIPASQFKLIEGDI